LRRPEATRVSLELSGDPAGSRRTASCSSAKEAAHFPGLRAGTVHRPGHKEAAEAADTPEALRAAEAAADFLNQPALGAALHPDPLEAAEVGSHPGRKAAAEAADSHTTLPAEAEVGSHPGRKEGVAVACPPAWASSLLWVHPASLAPVRTEIDAIAITP